MPSTVTRAAKRAIDVTLASLGLAATLPLLPLIALAIRLESPGPIFFAQPRVCGLLPGKDRAGRQRYVTFLLYKFRTMCNDAERETGAILSSKNDPRVTRVGRLLRKTRLDELPQLWNVLRGEMSLVGPRPERPELCANLAAAIPFFEERLRGVKPGITGLAQVHLRYTGAIPETDPLWKLRHTLQNPFHLEQAAGALADDMRAKLFYDLAYCVALEDFGSYLRMELAILASTPMVMLRKIGE